MENKHVSKGRSKKVLLLTVSLFIAFGLFGAGIFLFLSETSALPFNLPVNRPPEIPTMEPPLLIDTAAPYIIEALPANGTQALPPDTDINIRLRDDTTGINASSIRMTVNGKEVIPSINGSKNEYTLTYQPAAGYAYGESVSIIVEAFDLAVKPNKLSYSFAFGISEPPDSGAPYVALAAPFDGAQNVSQNTAITLHVHDDESELYPLTIKMLVNGAQVTPSISGEKNDYQLSYKPPAEFKTGEAVTVTVEASDIAPKPNNMKYIYTFYISKLPPVLTANGNLRLNVVYYGKHTEDVNSLILSVKPQVLICNTTHGIWGEAYDFKNPWLLHDVKRFQAAGIKVIGYITSGYEERGSGSGMDKKWYTLDINKKFIKNMAELDGVDGIFIDECSQYPNEASKKYLKELVNYAHSYGLIVWGNTGHNQFSDWYFTDGGFDYMHSSEQWNGQALSSVQKTWGHRMGITGFNTSYSVTKAYELTKDAWDKGIAYAYISTTEYSSLPEWLAELGALLRKLA